MSETVEELLGHLSYSAARSVARQFHPHTTAEDLHQEGILYLLERRHRIEQELAEAEDADKLRQVENRILLRARRHMERHARREKAVRCGYKPADEFFYDLGMLTEFMPAVILFDQTSSIIVEQVNDGTPRRPAVPSEGNNMLAMIVDIKRIYDKLPTPDQVILEQYFGENMTYSQIGEAWSMSRSWSQKRIKDLLTAMLRQLGGESPWWP